MEPVSIILPTYNRATILTDAIESVLQQTYSEFELLIVDDGSTDDTEACVRRINDSRIRYIRLSENSGAANARNKGILQASFPYIAFQDSDDYWKKDKLEKQMNYLTNHPEVGLLYCSYECKKTDGSIAIVPDSAIPLAQKQGHIYPFMLQKNTIGAPTVLFRKECLNKSGLFCSELTCLEDWDFFLRIAKHFEIAFQDEIMVIVNMLPNGVSNNISGYYDARCRMIAEHRSSLLKYGLFNDVVSDVLNTAECLGIIEPISKMLQYYLQQDLTTIE